MSYRLDTQLQSSTLYLDSTNCVSRSPYFKYELATAISCPTGARMLLSVIGASIPNVINNVTEYNNKLSIQYNTGVSVIIFTVTIPVGIYSAWSFASYLNADFVANGHDITCIYDHSQFRYTFISTHLFNIVNFQPEATTCSNLIGVAKNSKNEYIFPLVAGNPLYSLVMPSTVNFIPTPFIFLKISNIPLSNINSRGNINDTLIRIPVNAEYGQMIQYRPVEVNRFMIQRSDINTVEIRLEDIHNNPLSIPSGVEIQCVFKFDYIYPPEPRPVDEGTIAHFFKQNPIQEVEEEEEIGAI